MQEFLSNPPDILFIWLFSLGILLNIGILFWILRDSEAAEPVIVLVLVMVVSAIFLGVTIKRYQVEKASEKIDTLIEDISVKTIAPERWIKLRNDLDEIHEIMKQNQRLIEEIMELTDDEVRSPDPRNDPLPSR